MKTPGIAGLVVLVTLIGAQAVSAQDLRGFVHGGVTSDVNRQNFPAFGGGIVVNAGQPWVAVGAQGETFFSWPYFAGRGTVFGQGQLRRSGTVRPFVLGGYGWGEEGGPMLGGGVEIRPHEKGVGLRATVEDYIVHVDGYFRQYTGHQVALRVGVVFR
jgi:hypothetical protein